MVTNYLPLGISNIKSLYNVNTFLCLSTQWITNFEIENGLKKAELYKGLFLNICHFKEEVSKSNLKLECEHMLGHKMSKNIWNWKLKYQKWATRGLKDSYHWIGNTKEKNIILHWSSDKVYRSTYFDRLLLQANG